MKMFMSILLTLMTLISCVADSTTDPLPPDFFIYPPPSSPVPPPEFDVDVHFHLILDKVLPALGGTVVAAIVVSLIGWIICKCRNFNSIQGSGDVQVGNLELNI
ncbi:hypothetical protein QL285_029579 [Trifolium repens]|nr:hypothetical protein QL285_029579 [Trifolium repens]